MKQPYTYSMPENFLRDKSVPARWRVLAIINGFIINGGCFYGSNEWLMEQLDCSEQTVSNAFKELEENGDVYIERTRRTRNVYRSRPKPVRVSDPNQTGVSDPSSFGTNSVSNSVKNVVVAEPPTVDIPIGKDQPTKKEGKAKYPNARTAFSWLPEYDDSWDINTTELRAGELLFKKEEIAVKKAAVYCKSHLQDEGFPIPRITPYLLITNWKRIYDYAKRNR